jgi:hypothetical protein
MFLLVPCLQAQRDHITESHDTNLSVYNQRQLWGLSREEADSSTEKTALHSL